MSRHQVIEEINNAMGAHGAWKLRLKVAISTGAFDGDPKTVGCDDKCAFGKWLYGPSIPQDIRAGVPYQVVRRLHSEFHQSAGAVVQEVVAGKSQRATTLLEGEYAERSDKLNRALAKWKRELTAAV